MSDDPGGRYTSLGLRLCETALRHSVVSSAPCMDFSRIRSFLCCKCARTALAYSNDREARVKSANEIPDRRDIALEVETSSGKRNMTDIRPIGDVHAEVRHQVEHEIAQQNCKMTGDRRHHQHLWLALNPDARKLD